MDNNAAQPLSPYILCANSSNRSCEQLGGMCGLRRIYSPASIAFGAGRTSRIDDRERKGGHLSFCFSQGVEYPAHVFLIQSQ